MSLKNGRLTDRGHKAKHESEIRVKKEGDNKLKMALKMNTQYDALYQSTIQAFDETQNAVYDALNIGLERVAQARNVLHNTLDQASTTPDGVAVFRAKDGTVYDQNRRVLTGDELINITWREGAPSWETYQEQLKNLEDAQEFLSRMQAHDQRLIELHAELKDKDNRVTENRMTEIGEELKEIHNDTASHNIRADFKTTEPTQPLDTTIKFDF